MLQEQTFSRLFKVLYMHNCIDLMSLGIDNTGIDSINSILIMIRSARIPEINTIANEIYTFTYDSYIAHNPIQPYNFCSCECLHDISQLHHIPFELVVRGFAILSYDEILLTTQSIGMTKLMVIQFPKGEK